jgi:hypothetical protein
MNPLDEYKKLYGLQNYRFLWIRGGDWFPEVAVVSPGTLVLSEVDDCEIHAALDCWLDAVQARKINFYYPGGRKMFDSWDEFLEYALIIKLAGI